MDHTKRAGFRLIPSGTVPDALREQRINPEDHGASVRIVSEMMRFPLLTSGSVVSPNPVRPWSVSYRNGPAPLLPSCWVTPSG